jgi:hypothetical protein
MSSVTRFLRQIPNSHPTYASNSLAVIATAACEFIPTGANYVGNYPPGVVIPAQAATVAAITNAAAGYSQVQPIVRDMGKTIFAATATSLANAQAGTLTGSSGYFRQIQVLLPQAISNTQGFNGGVSGSVFGVVGGSPTTTAQYLTVYVPTSVNGVYLLPGGSAAQLTEGPQGQM